MQNYLRQKSAIQQIIKSEQAFNYLMTSIKDAYTRTWDEQLKKALIDSLDDLREFTPEQIAAFGEKESSQLLKTIEIQAGAAAMQSALRGPTLNFSEAFYGAGLSETVKDAGLDVVFGKPDRATLNRIKNSNLFWIGEHWDSHTGAKFEKLLSEYFDTGLTRNQLASKMAEDFAYLGKRTASYWDLLADHAGTKSREIGRQTVYEAGGIKKVRIKARLDGKTTKICLALNDKLISVERMGAQIDEYLSATERRDAEAAKEAWPMYQDNFDIEKLIGSDEMADVGPPPYHFRCRTITVVEFS